MELFRKIKWYFQGKPMLSYPGYRCGCCGKWINEPFEIPTYESCGEYWDGWGTCPGKGCQNAIGPDITEKLKKRKLQ